MNYKAILAGAITGFVTAASVDIHAWQQSNAPFDIQKAWPRWVIGLVMGALTAAGLPVAGIQS